MCLIGPGTAAAQDLAVGTWNGTLTIGGAQITVMFTVHPEQAQYEASMRTADGPQSPVSALAVTDNGVAFTWGVFHCTLSRRESMFQGRCTANDGTDGELQLTTPPTSDAVRDAPRNSDVLTGDELLDAGATDLYDAVRRLRPQWLKRLRPDGPTVTVGGVALVSGEVMVFLGRQALGGADALHQYSATDIAQLRFYGPRDAIVEFGSRNQGGVIQITRR